jgi:2-oxoglutarate dehydrogenase E2 component (dihydrolipoamide succinyltransferase)
MQIVYAPRINPNDETIKINKYLVENGSAVKANDPILEIETSKVAQEIESPVDGFVQFMCPEGEDVNVGLEIFRVHVSEFELETDVPASSEVESNLRRKISKKAEAMLTKHGLSAAEIPGDGIITAKQIEKMLENNKAIEGKPDGNLLDSSQKMVAANLRLSVDTNIHARLTAYIKLDCREISQGVTILDLMAVSVSKALKKYTCFNHNLVGDVIVTNENINIGFTVDLDGKLLISTVSNCNDMSTEDFSEKRTESMMKLMRASSLAQDNKPTFVISVIESKHISMHYPLIFPGNSGILAIAIQESNSDIKNVGLCIAYDHRFINGSIASKFLDEVISGLPASLLK